MKVIKKFTALRMDTKKKELSIYTQKVQCKLDHGEDYDGRFEFRKAETEFDTDEEAMKYAYEMDSSATWLIVPVIRFENE